MEVTFLSLIPPLLVLFSAFITKDIIKSLVLGILSATLIATNFSITNTIKLTGIKLWENSEIGKLTSWNNFLSNQNLFIFSFIICVGIIITLIAYSGGTYAYSKLMRSKIESAKGAEAATFFLSSLLFVDDFFNSLTVGSVMHSVTDSFKIPRAKLAFLVHSMATPLSILIPISSWVGFILTQLKTSGIDANVTNSTLIIVNPFFIFLSSIPYVFYSLILITSVWFIIRKRISFGKMYQHEKIAQKTGNLFGNQPELNHTMQDANKRNKKNSSIYDMILPISFLIFSALFNILYSGNYWLLGGENSLVKTLQASNFMQSLFLSGIITLIFCILFFLFRGKILFTEMPKIFNEGFMLMASTIVILILAWTFGNLLKDYLHTGDYIANILISSVDIRLLPFLFFLTGAITSFSIGSSWATIAILIPIAIPMLISFSGVAIPTNAENIIGFLPTLGAIFSGAIFGDHTSPIGSASIMAAKSSGCNLMDHVQTQLAYAIPVFISTAIAFLMAGFLNKFSFVINLSISLVSGILICLLILSIRDKMQKRS